MRDKILIVEDQFVEANHLRLMLKNAGYTVSGIARSVEDAKASIRQEKPGLVLLDIFLSGKGTGIDLARYLKEENIAFIYLSANSDEDVLNKAKATHPYGFLVKPFREKDLLVTMEIAQYHQEHGLESLFRKELFFQKQLKAMSGSQLSLQDGLLNIVRALQPLIPFDFVVLKTTDDGPDSINGFLRISYNEYQSIGVNEFQVITKLKMHEMQSWFANENTSTAITLHCGDDFEAAGSSGMKQAVAKYFGMHSHISLPVKPANGQHSLLQFHFFSRQPFGFDEEHLVLSERLQGSLAQATAALITQCHKNNSSDAATAPAPNIIPSPGTEEGFYGIVGTSPLLLKVFDDVTQVAASDTSVLILGESGTGKERIAEIIHRLSPRAGHPMVKINCAALPPNLIESELFGHEKGAFTGALDRRTGKFEQASNGTIFLDEIGEMPLDMQAKLLRVLQEREIDRIGGKVPIKVNLRIITATNRNLEKEVAEGRFRLDLYYRLNVFPIQLPPLRERTEDIGILTRHFIAAYSRKTAKNVRYISDAALKNLLTYHWPGNIRELENLVERSVVLAKGDSIEEIPLPVSRNIFLPAEKEELHIRTIEENEKSHILAVLKKCNGRIRGNGGAAEILGVPPTTLASKMKKLGIRREFRE
ncbi:response regulator [Deminuibacter soli]|uniref:Response regulator n=1 Tax=Deminuibacter soli TaxID=2291815 RepID=A0A3E1NIZ2_9BACT|nr:response regulator [Deminuibacter soli]